MNIHFEFFKEKLRLIRFLAFFLAVTFALLLSRPVLAQFSQGATQNQAPQNSPYASPYGPAATQGSSPQSAQQPGGAFGSTFGAGQTNTTAAQGISNSPVPQLPMGQQAQTQLLQQLCLNPTLAIAQIRSNPGIEVQLLLNPYVQKTLLGTPTVVTALLNNSEVRSRILSDPNFRNEMLSNPVVQSQVAQNPTQARSILNDPNAQAAFLAANPTILAGSTALANLITSDTVLQNDLVNNPDLQSALFNNPTVLQNACSAVASTGGYTAAAAPTSAPFPATAAPGPIPTTAAPGQPPTTTTGMPSLPPTPGAPQVQPSVQPSVQPTLQPVAAQVPLIPAQQQGWPYQQQAPTQTIIQSQPNPYANVPSLYDLYQQVAPNQPQMQRFGINIFQTGTGNASYLPMDVPVGPDYVVGPGDVLSLEMWGGYSNQMQLTVDPMGRVQLPEAGPVLVEGKTLAQVQQTLQTALRHQFNNVRVDVSLASVGTIRVYVVGDVMRPGAYDISALSTALNALFAAGGPTTTGSLRVLMHYRGSQLIRQVDVYDLLLHGVKTDIDRLQPGDTILVPPIGPQVTVQGMVRRPAIYELRTEKSLADMLVTAGGVLPTGTLRHIEVDRVEAHQRRNMLKLDLPADGNDDGVNKTLQSFAMQDGDLVTVSPILPYDYQTVYLDGHVYHPGKYPYHEGMHVRDVIKSYADMLPEPYRPHGEIIRLTRPDYMPQVIAFNVSDAMDGKIDPELQPFDTIRIFGRFDFEDPPSVTVLGEVRAPGPRQINGVMHLRDAIFLAGGLTPNAMLDDAQVVRRADKGWVQVLNVNLQAALDGSEADNIVLQNLDEIHVHEDIARLAPPTVNINGEVAKPGPYTLGRGMRVSDLIGLSGGLLRSAYRETADLSRYSFENGVKVESKVMQVDLAKILSGDSSADVELKEGDVLAIRRITGWNDIGASVTVDGEVVHPGTFGIRPGERLSSVLMRAGGLRDTAYAFGAVLQRTTVQQLEEQNKENLITRIEDQQFAPLSFGTSSSSGASDTADLEKAFLLQQQQVITHLKETPVSGRLVVHISSDLKNWAGTVDDIEMRSGDVLIIPKKPNFILVAGEVYSPNAISVRPGKNAQWYLKQAGGTTELAKKSDIYVVRANGQVVGKGSGGGWWGGSVKSLVLQPGDSVIVPEKILIGTSTWQHLVEAAQVVGGLALAGRFATSF